jgi:hypothetical protein
LTYELEGNINHFLIIIIFILYKFIQGPAHLAIQLQAFTLLPNDWSDMLNELNLWLTKACRSTLPRMRQGMD